MLVNQSTTELFYIIYKFYRFNVINKFLNKKQKTNTLDNNANDI